MTAKAQNSAPSRAQAAREALVDAALPNAAFDGWSEATLAQAARDAGLSEGEVQLYCPAGILDVIETWTRRCDAQARAEIEANPANRIRDKVSQGVLVRLAQYEGEEEAAARARARLLLPDGLDRGARLVWATSHMIWSAIGDTSTDGNFYSKRAILSGVYASTFAIWLEDDSEDRTKSAEFLDRRIDNVMQFEKVKGQVRKLTKNLPDFTAIMGDLRYGMRRAK
jgi:ubiquinone biosynthesis protein COQ9